MSYDPVARTNSDKALGYARQALAIASSVASAALEWTVISADHLATAGESLSVDTSSGPVTVTLPADGGAISLRDNAGTWDVHPVTVAGNGVLISGAPTLACDIAGYQIDFAQVAGGWRYVLTFLYGGAA
ncbi:hypothetical protein Y88_0443 [Novosphingobium nitrogenifigens DSM 19370]|uniref:Uncharacterized protein n=1 Tax=Novosphingobium nitrogenifigens DSM 19370 TaxID=983920 RepID=F1Z9B6_9SPHN|nr:hypothetical protein [Novosphingobium nitrogenifigens]EGD58388.1 hypothetical protein Y88_0443 [Novosphingobium nitrogenifigens DSM 19370]